MGTILITGMSGVGTSTVLAHLAARGYAVVDTDYGGYSYEAPLAEGSGVEQLWREDRLADLLANERPDFVSGCASNQGRFYDTFDAVILLSAPVDVMRERLASRTTNSFGKSPEELRRILRDQAEMEPILRASATAEIVTTAPIEAVVDAVEDLATRHRRESSHR